MRAKEFLTSPLPQHTVYVDGVAKFNFDNRIEADLYAKMLSRRYKVNKIAKDIEVRTKDSRDAKLYELWTRPYELTSRVIGPASLEYYFDTKDNRSGRIVFDSSLDTDQGGLHVRLVIVHFYIDNLYHTTGKGDAVAIFSTVVAACRDYLRRYRPPVVVFETDDEKKRNLYVKMSRMFTDYVAYPNWRKDPVVGDEILDSLTDGVPEDAVVLHRRDYVPEKTRLYVDEQGVAENFADGRKFVKPNFDVEWEEAERYPEFVKLGKDAWIKLARKGRAVVITSAQGINNTDAGNPDSFKSLHPEKQKRALAQLEKGTVEMPIVAVYSDGRKELVGGNTRFTAMMARDGQATVWAFRVPSQQGVAEATGDEKFDTMMGRIATEPKVPDIHQDMPPTSIPELLQWAKENNKPYHYKFAEWAKKHNFTNVNAALMWFGDNVDPWDEFGPKDHLNVFGDLVGEPLIDAAKHNPKAAELLKVFASYEKIVFDWTDEYRQMKEQGVAEGSLEELKRNDYYGGNDDDNLIPWSEALAAFEQWAEDSNALDFEEKDGGRTAAITWGPELGAPYSGYIMFVSPHGDGEMYGMLMGMYEDGEFDVIQKFKVPCSYNGVNYAARVSMQVRM